MSVALELLGAVAARDRRALSKAITLVESSHAADRKLARELVARLIDGGARSFRVGVTGVPGAGKSTLIDGLGMLAIAEGRRVAVLAIDPSSRRSGGSVLGDKTRMTRLASNPAAFVRPSSTRGVLGGTGAHTREAILLCELAGYDLVFVETVGIGQSEEQVATMVDCILLVLLSGAGDELSSMKRGVLESANLIAINKADGGRAMAVENEATSLRASLAISRPHAAPVVLAVSARAESAALGGLWRALCQFEESAQGDGSLLEQRRAQRRDWFEAALEEAFRELFVRRPDLLQARTHAEQRVLDGELSAAEAAQGLISSLLTKPEP